MRKRRTKQPEPEQTSMLPTEGPLEADEDMPEWAAEARRLLGELDRAYQEGRMDEVERLMGRVTTLAEDHAEEMDNPQMPYLMQSTARQTEGDWEGAEAALREALRVSDSPLSEWYAHNELITLYRLLDRDEDALAAAGAAVEAIRRDQEAQPVLFNALDTVAVCAVSAEEPERALPALEEALALGAGEAPPERLAPLFAMRARARHQMGDIEGARADLATAWDGIPGKEDETPPPDARPALVRYWSTTARLCAAGEDYEGALAARETALRCLMLDADNPMAADALFLKILADSVRALGEAQAAVGDLEEARGLFEEARELYREIGLPDPRGCAYDVGGRRLPNLPQSPKGTS